MGRLQPSVGQAPASFRKAARAKRAKATVNQVIPSLLPAHPRARRGIEAAELIVDQGPANVSTKAEAQIRSNHERQARDSSPPIARSSSPPAPLPSPHIKLRVTDTLTAARALVMEPVGGKSSSRANDKPPANRVAILNMASPLNPGGGFLNGAGSQEEYLCMRTTLLPSLKDEWYRLPELGAIYTPDVLVFRGNAAGENGTADAGTRNEEDTDAVLDKKDRWFVDCITAALLRNPDTEEDDGAAGGAPGERRYASDKDRKLVLDKMRMVVRICRAKGIQKVVLGAWGCGAYGNPVGEVARAWRNVLLPRPGCSYKGSRKGQQGPKQPETWEGVEEIVFAIKDAGMAAAFEAAFGEGLERVNADDDDGDTDDEGNIQGEGAASADVRELQDRIQELRLRLESIANLDLKQGLGQVLARMVSQLPSEDREDAATRI